MTTQKPQGSWAEALQSYQQNVQDLSDIVQKAPASDSAAGWDKEKLQDDCATIVAWAKKNRATTAGWEGMKLTFPASPPDFVEMLMTAPEKANVPGWSKEKAVRIANDLKSFADGLDAMKD